MHRLYQIFIVLRQRGVMYLFYLISGYSLPQIWYYLLYQFPRKQTRRLLFVGVGSSILLVGALLVWVLGWDFAVTVMLTIGLLGYGTLWLHRAIKFRTKQHFARHNISHSLNGHSDSKFTAWSEYPLDPRTRQAIEVVRKRDLQSELLIGQIDNDGRVYGLYGYLPYVHNITHDEFVPRHRFPLDIVILKGVVLVRKDFRRNRERFIREWYNLARLDGNANVPAIYKVDEERCIVYKNLIVGRTVRDMLVEAGANILNIEVEKDANLQKLSKVECIHAVWKRGEALLSSTLPESFFEQMEKQLDQMHTHGLAKLSLTFGNIMLTEDGRPWFVDMEGAEDFARTSGFRFDYERNRDREKYNQIYGRNIITEQSARQILSARFSNVYAPIDFGRGLAAYGFWTTDSGTGRWEYLNGRVVAPLVMGKRVLDLGANNGLLDVMMLKSGARQVVGLEFSPEFTERARLVQKIFEWRDMCKYAFTIHNCDMRAMLTTSFGEFDVVTAFCSLYYLEPEDMAAVVRKAASIAPVIILQAKTHARREAEVKGKKSSPEYLAVLLKQNGFSQVETIAPKGFTRPILIGRK